MDWRELDATAVAERTRSGELGAEEATRLALAEIQSQDPCLSAFLSVDEDGALARARELDRSRGPNVDLGPLHGVPVAIKANLCLTGSPTSCASRMLEDWRAPYTATAVERLLAAGAVVLGSTNMDEFAMGSSTENSAFQATANPWAPGHTPGGSSGGSATCVASGMVPLALGSDTGGSVRQPAAFTGILGFKPSYGRVSRYGLVAFGSSLDQVSPLTRSARDLALVTSLISGLDARDSTSLDSPAPSATPAELDLGGLRVGVSPDLAPEEVEPGVRACFEQALELLESAGAQRVEVALPHARHALSTYYVLATAEASSNLARFEGVRYGRRVQGDGSLTGMFEATRAAGFGSEVKRRILLGTFVLSAGYSERWYGQALKVRSLLRDDFRRAFEQVDVLIGPTTPGPAFRLGERVKDPVAMYAADLLTTPANLAGLPAASVPAGFVREQGQDLPAGVQITAAEGGDELVLAVVQELAQRAGTFPLPPRRTGDEA